MADLGWVMPCSSNPGLTSTPGARLRPALQGLPAPATSPSPPSSPAPPAAASVCVAAAATAVGLCGALSSGRRRGARRRPALGAAAATSAALRQAARKRRSKEERREEVNMLESALLSLFEKEQPSIYKVREVLTRLAGLASRPNQMLAGDWIVFWASREGCVDKTFGTGVTVDDMWLQMQEFLLKIGSRKEGRKVEAAEVIRKVGPFPNLSNCMRGTYEIKGTNGLRMTFDEVKTDEGNAVEVNGEKISERVIDVDVIYSSPKLIAMQTEDEAGECDFYVLTPVRDVKREVDKLLGLERRRFFFS